MEGLNFSLSVDAPPYQPLIPVDPTAMDPGTEAELRARLPSLPELPEPPSFAFSEGPKPPERTGEQMRPAFPDSSAPAPESEKAEPQVTSYSPEGSVESARRVRITFSAPRAALTSHEQQEVPARITPQPEGKWRWAGTQTLLFESRQPFPMATDYEVEVDGERFGFHTPAPRLVDYLPAKGSQPADPILVLVFNQRMSPDDVLAHSFLTDGRGSWGVRQVTQSELEGHHRALEMTDQAKAGHWVAVRPQKELPLGREFNLVLTEQLPSGEGPRRSKERQGFCIQTYGPLRLVHVDPSSRPGTACWGFEFSNELDPESVKLVRVEVEPELPFLRLTPRGNTLYLGANASPNTSFRVKLSTEIKDVFGQRLQETPEFEVRTERADPLLAFGADRMLIRTPGQNTIPLYVIDHDVVVVELYRVSLDDWSNRIRKPEREPDWCTQIRTVPEGGDWYEHWGKLFSTEIDLTPALDGDTGHVLVVARPEGRKEYYEQTCWVQVIELGLVSVQEELEAVVWASSLVDGRPLAGVSLQLGAQSALTNDKGVARLPLPSEPANLIGCWEDQKAILSDGWFNTLQKKKTKESCGWYGFNDRGTGGVYRPGETLVGKGWLRTALPGVDQLLELPNLGEVEYEVYINRSLVDSGVTPVNSLGGLDFRYTINQDAPVGQSWIIFSKDHYTGGFLFQIEEFRRPEFELKVRSQSGPHVVGDQATLTTSASYFTGQPLTQTQVRWVVRTDWSGYSPVGWSDFSFSSGWPVSPAYAEPPALPSDSIEGWTDARGRSTIKVDCKMVSRPQPTLLSASCTVIDHNRQSWTDTTRLLVHASRYYVGLKTSRSLCRQQEEIEIQYVVVDLDGEVVSGVPVTLEPRRKDESFQEHTLVSGDQPQTHILRLGGAGAYEIWAHICDPEGRVNCCSINLWVLGDNWTLRDMRAQELQLVPDKKVYEPGDEVELAVIAPFEQGEGLLTVSRDKLFSTTRFSFRDHCHQLRIPVPTGRSLNLNVRVDLVGPGSVFAEGRLSLAVEPSDRRLQVQVSPEERELEPGGETRIQVTVLDSQGVACGGVEVALVVVDEAVLALSGGVFRLADRILSDSRSVVSSVSMWKALSTRFPTIHAEGTGVTDCLPGAFGEEEGGGSVEPIEVRKDFNALAHFSPTLVTDERGQVSADVTLPDNLTRYRVIAVAAGVNQFGSGESTLVARLPLMIRPSPPRFLNYGDQFELPVMVHNTSGQDQNIEVLVRAGNLENEGTGLRVLVPAQERREIRFPLKTTHPGEAHLQVLARGASLDSWQNSVPVWTPACTEAFSTYGELDQGRVTYELEKPRNVYQQLGGLKISTSTTALQALTDSFLYLRDYPYECAEQLASRLLGFVSLKDVLPAFEGLEESPESVEAHIDACLARLVGAQSKDGGWGFWSGGSSWPFLSTHVAHALVRANACKMAVESDSLDRAREYLQQLDCENLPEVYGERARLQISAYRLHVLKLLGETVPGVAKELISDGFDRLPAAALGWVLPSLDDPVPLLKHLLRHSEETASTASFTDVTDVSERTHCLAGGRRDDAIILEGLLQADSSNHLIPKLVRGLLAHRVKGRWSNTQENCFVLMALSQYFRQFESEKPDLIARIWLGERLAVEEDYKGRCADARTSLVPTSELESAPVIVAKEGKGRLYYRLGLESVPLGLEQPSAEHGFFIERWYEAVECAADVEYDDEVWKVRAGAKVEVVVRFAFMGRRHHVAMTDPLPAGLEPINLALSGTDAEDQSVSRWVQRQALRDDRVEVFATMLQEDVYEFRYRARATTPGLFVIPAPRVEEMYRPECFGRGESGRMKVWAG